MECRECKSDNVHLEMVQSCDGQIQFHVDCENCGTYSHRTTRGMYEKAVEDFLKKRRTLLKRFEEAAVAQANIGSKPPAERVSIMAEYKRAWNRVK